MKVVKLPVDVLELCDRTRSRKLKPKEGSEIVQEYAEAYQAGLILEPLDVFCEKGAERYIVADGEHRLLALRRAKIKEVECRLREGGEVDALRFALTTNQAHGLRLTKEDRYYRFCRIKETALEKEFRTDRDLADAIGVSERTIQRYNVDWRNSQSGDKRTLKAKEKKREAAAKHPGRPSASKDVKEQEKLATARPVEREYDSCHIQGEPRPLPASATKNTAGSKPDPSWTPAAEHGYRALLREWSRAEPIARERFLREIAP